MMEEMSASANMHAHKLNADSRKSSRRKHLERKYGKKRRCTFSDCSIMRYCGASISLTALEMSGIKNACPLNEETVLIK